MTARLCQFLTGNGFDPAAGVSHLLPPAAEGSVLYLFTSASRLAPGQQLSNYRQLVSDSGLFNFIMQSDGNVALYRITFGLPLWTSNTTGAPDGSYTRYRSDLAGQVPSSPTDYVLYYRINGKSCPAWWYRPTKSTLGRCRSHAGT